jgi:hypothetical protein
MFAFMFAPFGDLLVPIRESMTDSWLTKRVRGHQGALGCRSLRGCGQQVTKEDIAREVSLGRWLMPSG